MRSYLLILTFGPLATSAIGESENRLLELVRAGNRAAVESIHPLSCSFTITQTTGASTRGVGRGRYWRDGDSFRLQYDGDKGLQEIAVNEGHFRSQKTRKGEAKPRGTLQGLRDKHNVLSPVDIWFETSMVLLDGTAVVSFDELLNGPQKVEKVRWETDEGRRLVYVQLTNEQVRTQVWFDPEVNYLIRKQVRIPHSTTPEGKSGLKSDALVTRYRETSPSIFFPEVVEQRTYASDKELGRRTLALANVRVNQPIDRNSFELSLPPGTDLVDQQQDKVFKVGPDGNPVGAGKSITKGPLATAPSRKSHTSTDAELASEPIRWTRWILSVAAAVLGLGLLLLVVRRWRCNSPGAEHK